eukprot:scaffold54408_cov60-Phaeocystis_antarctica.AAC.3
MGRATWNKAAADRSANIMEGKYPNTRTLTIILAANHANPNPNIMDKECAAPMRRGSGSQAAKECTERLTASPPR